MDLQRDDTGEHDIHAIKILRDQCKVGHIPCDTTNLCSYLYSDDAKYQ